MKKWQYDITAYSAQQVLAERQKMGLETGASEPALFCNEKGVCFFDQLPNPNTQAILQLLNARGQDGWQLATVTFRAEEMICFWMREIL
jgi:hypothetical protein